MSKEDVGAGNDAAKMIVPAMMFSVSSAEEHAAWWAGFIGTIVGCAAADIGVEAVMVITETACEMVPDEE